MTRLEKDYYRALESLYVYDEFANEYINAAKLDLHDCWVTELFEEFYTLDDETGEYEIDYRAFDDLQEIEGDIDAEYNGYDEVEEF